MEGLCPAHSDQRESLSFKDGEKAVLLKCHAGCDERAICEHLGIHIRELFFDAMPHTNGQPPTIVKTYDYCDEQGVLLYQVVRFEPKDFRQRRPDGHGGWQYNLKDTRRVVYRLPELIGHSSVFVVEGEKRTRIGSGSLALRLVPQCWRRRKVGDELVPN